MVSSGDHHAGPGGHRHVHLFLFLMMSLAALVAAGVSLVVELHRSGGALRGRLGAAHLLARSPAPPQPVHAHHALQTRTGSRPAGHRARARDPAQRAGPTGGGRLDRPSSAGPALPEGLRGVRHCITAPPPWASDAARATHRAPTAGAAPTARPPPRQT
ncbi:hypothetical protein QJS66_04375 [Kocuria rhizophila]|nr:hypothetical protein QJS66_04375 [Kocuria rhizophila]